MSWWGHLLTLSFTTSNQRIADRHGRERFLKKFCYAGAASHYNHFLNLKTPYSTTPVPSISSIAKG